MAGVPARDPDALLAGHAPGDRQEVQHEAEDSCPAVRDREGPPDELGHERLERVLELGRRSLVVRELRLEREVAEAAREDAAVGDLLPVVEAVAAVVGAREDALAERLGRDHLSAGRDDQSLDRAEEPAGIPVGGDEHLGVFDLVERADAALLPDLDSGLGRGDRESAHPPRRLQGGIARVEDRGREAAADRLLDPFGREAVLTEELVLDPEGLLLLVVAGEPETARATEGVSRERLEPIERMLGQLPEAAGVRPADHFDGDVVRGRSAAKSEAPVPSARASGNLARVVEPDSESRLRQLERRGAAGDPAPDDHGVGRPVQRARRDRRCRLVQPVAGPAQRRNEVAFASGTKARLPTSLTLLSVLYA